MNHINNPIIQEELTILNNNQRLHKLTSFYIIFLLILTILTGPKKITIYAISSHVPMFHLIIWFGSIIGFIGINLYWSADQHILSKYWPVQKWFAYTDITVFQFFSAKIVLSFLETAFLLLFTAPFVLITTLSSGYGLDVIIPALLIIFISNFICRFITSYFHSTFSGKNYIFSLNFLFMYFWFILIYIGTLFMHPAVNIGAAFFSLEPTTKPVFRSLASASVFPFFRTHTLSQNNPVSLPVWFICFCSCLFLIISFCIYFYIKLLYIREKTSKQVVKKGNE